MTKRTQSRPAISRNEIVSELRRRITSGGFVPGSRLPTHRVLGRELRANIVTLGRAIDQLKLEGFISTQGARGTFVSEYPPHLFRYGLVFPSHSSTANWPRYWEALAKEAATIERDRALQIAMYYDVCNELRNSSPDFERLIDDVQAHRVAGLIFASHPWVVTNTPLLDEPNIPRVALMDPQPNDYPGVVAVRTDREGLVDRALDYLAGRGRKRLGVLTVPAMLGEGVDAIRRKAAERGMETRPYWLQSAGPMTPRSAQAIMHLMMRDRAEERPDALFVTDDNLVEYAAVGLVDAGVRVPDDADVVVHCNFPWPTPSILPVKRIGFDVRAVLRVCIDTVVKQRMGEVVPPSMRVSAQFEEEVV